MSSKLLTTVIQLKKPKLQSLMKQLYLKCKKDAIYFMKNYCYITTKTGKKIKFKLWEFQLAVVGLLQSHDWNIILKSRQMGISTLSAAYALWFMLFHLHKIICIIANKQKTAANMLRKMSLAYKALPSWLQIGCLHDVPLQLLLTNGSRVIVLAASLDAGRSLAVSLLIIDLMAIIKPRLAELIWLSSQPTITGGGKLIILSTPKGIGNMYFKLWSLASQGLSLINPILLQWYLHPERDQLWYKKLKSKYGKRGFAQLYECSFLASGDNVIDNLILKYYMDNVVQEPIHKDELNCTWIFKWPESGHSYLISADVARGDGGDYSAFHVFDVDTLLQVVLYKGKIDTQLFGKTLLKYAKMYFNALIACLNASIGWAVLQYLIDLSYKNIYYTLKDVQVVNRTSLKYVNNPTDDSKGVPGFTTSSKTRPLIVLKLQRFMYLKVLLIRSKRLITLMYTFIYSKRGKPLAMQGYNDDLTLSAAIGIWVRETAIKARLKSRQKTKQMMKLTGKSKYLESIRSGYDNPLPYMILLGDGTLYDTRTDVDKINKN